MGCLLKHVIDRKIKEEEEEEEEVAKGRRRRRRKQPLERNEKIVEVGRGSTIS